MASKSLKNLNCDLLSRFLSHLSTMITSRTEMIAWVNGFIDDIKAQETAVNTVKTATAVTGVVSAIALFTPFAPFALAGLVASGVGGVATMAGDLIANKIKSGTLGDHIDSMKAEDSKFEKLQRELNEQAELLRLELNISLEEAKLFLLVGITKVAAQADVQVVNGAVSIVRVLPHLKAIKDAMTFGASFTQAVKLSSTVFQEDRLTVVGAEGITCGIAAAAGTTLAVTTAAKALGGLGAVIGVADAVFSWTTANPNRESAEDLLPKLKENLKSLEDMEQQFLKMKDDM